MLYYTLDDYSKATWPRSDFHHLARRARFDVDAYTFVCIMNKFLYLLVLGYISYVEGERGLYFVILLSSVTGLVLSFGNFVVLDVSYTLKIITYF